MPILGFYGSRMRCVRPIWDNLDVESRGASTSTFKSDAAPFPPLPPLLLSLLLFGTKISDDFFSNFQSCITQNRKHSCNTKGRFNWHKKLLTILDEQETYKPSQREWVCDSNNVIAISWIAFLGIYKYGQMTKYKNTSMKGSLSVYLLLFKCYNLPTCTLGKLQCHVFH